MQSMKRTISLLTLIPALVLGASTSLLAQEQDGEMQQDAAAEADHEADIEAATKAALAWLQIVDDGDYEASWEAAAGMLKDQVTLGQWNAAIGDARSQVDPLGERNRTSAEYTTELPGAPAGEYVVLQFRTAASGDRTVGETVVPMKEDGAWKVSGYFVRP